MPPFVVREDISCPQPVKGRDGQEPQQEARGRWHCRPVTTDQEQSKDNLRIDHDA